nr:apolipoprotein N-acyltransferase [Simiduia aestuariiviva]
MPPRLRAPLALVAALAAGLCQPLGLAPFDLWPVALLGLMTFFAVIHAAPKQTAGLSFAFGLGMYGLGVSWVFVSIHGFGQAGVPLALLLTGIFITFLAAVFALPFWLWHKYVPGAPSLWALPLLWVLNEGLRTWLFTGFPWLFIGYGHLASPLAGWAPIVGIYGLGLLLTATAIVPLLIRTGHRSRWPATIALALVWTLGTPLQSLEWTQPIGPERTVAMVQPNIPQEHKWDPDWLQPTYDRLVYHSADLWSVDWLIWPEAALPTLLSEAQPFLAHQAEQAQATHTALVTGVIVDEPRVVEQAGRRFLAQRYYNSLVVVGQGHGLYHKQRLVPFGEYVPFEDQLRGLIEFFNLPMSVLHRGPSEQQPLVLGQSPVWPAVCYEIVYPDLIAAGSRNAHAILTVSNDAWFGGSIAPIQHLQMAQMRALETQRPVLRATNNGISALIDERGHITAQAPQFELTTLSGSVQPRAGQTPFMITGSLPLMMLCALLLGGLVWQRRERS